jgi:small subunit ribosomal protein S1
MRPAPPRGRDGRGRDRDRRGPRRPGGDEKTPARPVLPPLESRRRAVVHHVGGDDAEHDEFAAALAAFDGGGPAPDRAPRPQAGDRLTARIVSFGAESAFVDLGGKAEGIVPLVELTDEAGQLTVAVGDTVEGVVASTADDTIVLRVRAGRGPAAPAELLQAHEHGLPVEGTVLAVVKGGVEVTVAGVRGFCPLSQLDARYVEDPAAFVGQRLTFRITRYEEGRGKGVNVVLSRRALLEAEAQARAERARAELEVGKVVRGRVTSLAAYGAFVDLGGIEGLLHVSEIGHGRVGHPQEVLAVGQEVEVQVLKIEPPDDKGRQRISLSTRALEPDPWHEEAARLAPGTRRSGRVARLESYGAFVELAPGVDGLLHLSELEAAKGREYRHAREALAVGQTVEVLVKSLDAETRRIALALAPLDEEADADLIARERAAGGPGSGFGALGDFFDKARKPKR